MRALKPLAIVALLCAVGCPRQSTSRSTLGTTVGSRTVKATIDGSAFIAQQDGTAVVTFADHQVEVHEDRVRLDGAELAQIPATATQVVVDYSGQVLTITADGAEIVSRDLR